MAVSVGDNVYIESGVSTVEDVTIGSNVTNGAGSSVTKDIPIDAIVAGNHAKILHYKIPEKLVKRVWAIE
ncbi:hypothetical protein [Streptococcus merionis]|uniref:Acetyltransferase n=1 Tax=Streptococcus merionis TaxID=400065 RepID=A0A239SSM2_9STRE|nr:hypothetical protein [Streptococcus merionis]SNU88279.1 acetyltransferase [Streptococcus merionis]